MQTYTIRSGYITEDKEETFRRMVEDLKAMPDLEPASLVSCHAVCRALEQRHAGATCVDGWFKGVGQEHSWIDLGNGIVADMYPVASSGPFMVDASHWMSPWHGMYKPKPDLLDGTTLNRAHHEDIARQLVAALVEHDGQP